MKFRLSKAEFDALSDAMKAFYQPDGDSYKLHVEGMEDTGELRRALDRERQDAKDQKARADRLQGEMDVLVADPNKLKDIKTLETSWQNKLNDQKNADKKTIDRLKEQLTKTLKHDKALSIATDIAGDNAHLVVRDIEDRLTINLDEDNPETRVLDNKGQLSASTLEDLSKEFVANPKYSVIIIASKASGGADSGNRNKNTSAVPRDKKKFADLTEAERIEWHKTDPQGFATASAKAAEDAALARRRV